jgi:hypothetical protein
VQTFALPADARPVALRAGQACGYVRDVGSGHATLLGTWPVADSVPGRIGDVFEIQDVPAGPGQSTRAAALAREMAARRWGGAVAAQVQTSPPPGAGRPQKVIVYDYPNERRGGEVITGGTVAYWDGENVVPTAQINLGTTVPGAAEVSRPEVSVPPFRPLTDAHFQVARALHGRSATCAASDRHAQARLLRARDSEASTISVVNRYEVDIELALSTPHENRVRRLPLAGQFTLPAGEALLLPLDYELGPHLTVEQATVQLLDAELGDRSVRLSVSSPRGGELVLRLPRPPTETTVDGRTAAVSATRSVVKVAIPAGQREVQIRWR